MARVLIVDDEQADRVFLEYMVEGIGHEVYFASDGEEALRVCIKRDIDVVVTDLNMPRVHGLELIMTLQTFYPKARIIAVSSTGPAQLAMAEAVGATAALSKPIDPQEFSKAISRLLPRDDDSSVRGQGSS